MSLGFGQLLALGSLELLSDVKSFLLDISSLTQMSGKKPEGGI